MKSENIKTLEIRDCATLIPAFAIKMVPSDEMELFLFKDAGYRSYANPYIILISLQAPWYARRYSADWENESPRTMMTAHKYIEENFHILKNGDVIDVEFILGEKERKSINSFIEFKIEMAKDKYEEDKESRKQSHMGLE